MHTTKRNAKSQRSATYSVQDPLHQIYEEPVAFEARFCNATPFHHCNDVHELVLLIFCNCCQTPIKVRFLRRGQVQDRILNKDKTTLL